jgi:hypothetical protein
MGPYAGVDHNLTLCPLQSRHQHIYHGQLYARVDLNPMPELTLSPSQGLWASLSEHFDGSHEVHSHCLQFFSFQSVTGNQERYIVDACSDSNPPFFLSERGFFTCF